MEEQETSISIKEEEIVEECNEPDSESCKLSAMDNKTTIWIKEEAADDVPEPGTTNAVVNTLLHTILEAESGCCPPPPLVPKKELFPDDTLGIPCLTDFIKEDPELILEADETENIVSINTSDLLHVE